MIRSFRTPVFAHVLGNVLLLGLGYYWLGLREGRASGLAWSAFVALVVVVLGCWTYGAALVCFRPEAKQRAIAAWQIALRNLLPLAIAALAIVVIYFYLARWADYSSTPAAKLASYLTLKFRRPIRPAAVLRGFNAVLWFVRWVILPVLVLPKLSAIAAGGWRGFRAFGALTRKWLYWIEAPLLLLCTVALPLKLLGWVPHAGDFGLEVVSFILRAAVAYLLFVIAWLALAFVSSGGSPRFTQAKTVASP